MYGAFDLHACPERPKLSGNGGFRVYNFAVDEFKKVTISPIAFNQLLSSCDVNEIFDLTLH
jgi:hypothetical protein